MDIRLTPNDRVTGGGKGKGPRKPKKAGPAKKPARGKAKTERREPSLFGFGGGGGSDLKAERRETAAKRGARTKRGRGRREKKPLTLGRIFGKLFYWGVVLGVWAAIGVIGIVVYYAVQLPSANSWAVPERPANIRIVAANGQLISNRGKMGGEAVSVRELPHYVPAAVIAIEDKRYMSHFGVDPMGILGAALDNLTGQYAYLRGGSTITQQVAKNLFLSPDQTLGRKVQEALLALWLEQNYTKDDILGLYLNRVYFGAGAYGIEAAAQRYFGKSARNLSLGEAAILAGLLQAPSRLSPDRHPEEAAARARVVLQVMADEGYISQQEAEAAAIDPNKRIRTRVAGAEYYVADWVETLITAYIGEVNQDVVVSTTIDWDLQKEAEFQMREMVRQHGEEKGFSQGALVSMTPDGAVRAIVGGVDYAQSQFNRAVTARRQPGSSFKPFVYLAAMEKGYTPETIADDEPFDYDGWSPQNYNDKYVGPVTLRDALANSLNTVAARLAIDVGPEQVVDAALRMGISSQLQPVPSIALGTQEVSLLELTAAYAPFANGGNGVIAHVITRIETADGQTLYDNIQAGPGQVIAPEIVGEMNDMLSTAVQIGTGRHADLPGWPIGGKTGTTQNNRDALFVGYSAAMVTGVWLCNDDGTPTNGVGGGSLPVEVWSHVMQKAHENLIVADLPGGGPLAPPTDIAQGQPEQPRRQTLVDLINSLFNNGR